MKPARSRGIARRAGGRGGRGTLVVVAALFAGSAAFRFAAGPGTAIADEVARPGLPATATPARDGSAILNEADLERLLLDLRDRESRVGDRERAVEARAAAAELAEARAREAIDQLEAAERDLRATIALADSAAENDLAQLTAVYENMKPQQAAPLFQQMTPAFAAGFLGRMRPDAAAAILSGLEPEAAYAISVILAGRNASVPTSDP